MTDIDDVIPFDIRAYGRPPKPTAKNPFAQVDWIFSRRGSRCATKASRSNYINAHMHYVRFLTANHGATPVLLRTYWDEFALLRFKEALDEHGNSQPGEESLSSHTRVGVLSCVRQTMLEALNYNLLDCKTIQSVSIGNASSETTAHTDYSEYEIAQIREAVATELRFTYAVLSGYKPQAPGKGRDPRIRSKSHSTDGDGWKIEENMRWYFEHEMGGIAVPTSPSAKGSYLTFFVSAGNYHGGLHSLYRRWGVSAFVTRDLIMPLAINLDYLSGLNPSSLLNLKTDSYRDEHPLTGMPYLAFEKARSDGEMELHLPLLDSSGEQSLKRKQALLVKKVFKTQLAITQKLRSHPSIKPADAKRLFIYQSGHPSNYGDVITLSSAQTSSWCKAMVEKYDLLSDKGDVLDFNLVRFRSTKLTEMALEGRDLFEIQQVARHRSIRTTLGYINKNRLDVKARAIVLKALETIRENREETIACNNSTDVKTQTIHLFKGIVSDCKNVYDPPERVKKSQEYVPGKACTRHNMCLFCKNVVVMREHLPVLATYRAQISSAQANNIQNLPHAELYDRTLELLNHLFDPKRSEFTEADIDWAIEMSESQDVVIDPLLYQGVAS